MDLPIAVALRPEDLLITAELVRRPEKPPDLAAEVAAFRDLASVMLDDPDLALQRFLEAALVLTGAGSAGLSLIEPGPEPREFVWEKLAGVYAEHVGGRTPLDFSPCGLCLSQGGSILVSRPGRVFDYFNAVEPGIHEGLIVPLYDTGRRPLGTLWIVSHEPGRSFCATDARIMEQLALQLVLAIKRREELDRYTDAQRERHRRQAELAAQQRELEEARRANAFLETVLAASGDSIAVLDREGRLVFMSAAGLQVLGAANLDQASGRTWRSFWEDAEGAEAAFRRALQGEALRFEGAWAGSGGRYWEAQLTPMLSPNGRRRQVVAICREVTEKRTAELHQKLLMNELNHRVKNSLATVQSIAVQSLRKAASVEQGRRNFEERLLALSRVHDILTVESWDGAALSNVVERALEPYGGRTGERFAWTGEPVRLKARQALAISMALQELVTNAMKYGALSRAEGRVEIAWSRTADNALSFAWRERNGPPVTPPTRRGFGSRLIERGLSQELSAAVRLAFEPNGVECDILAPLDA